MIKDFKQEEPTETATGTATETATKTATADILTLRKIGKPKQPRTHRV